MKKNPEADKINGHPLLVTFKKTKTKPYFLTIQEIINSSPEKRPPIGQFKQIHSDELSQQETDYETLQMIVARTPPPHLQKKPYFRILEILHQAPCFLMFTENVTDQYGNRHLKFVGVTKRENRQ